MNNREWLFGVPFAPYLRPICAPPVDARRVPVFNGMGPHSKARRASIPLGRLHAGPRLRAWPAARATRRDGRVRHAMPDKEKPDRGHEKHPPRIPANQHFTDVRQPSRTRFARVSKLYRTPLSEPSPWPDVGFAVTSTREMSEQASALAATGHRSETTSPSETRGPPVHTGGFLLSAFAISARC